MPILADRVDVVIGVDAHTDTHTAALVTALGAVIAELTVAADEYASQRLTAWVEQYAAGKRRAWVVDGTRSHGVGLLRQLLPAGEEVLEAPRLKRSTRRGKGKSDSIDAVAIARVALTAQTRAVPRADGTREAMRILLVVRRHHSDSRTATVNLLKALILTADDDLRGQLRRHRTSAQVRLLCQLPDPGSHADALSRIRRQQMTDLARRISDLDHQLRQNKAQLHTLTPAACHQLLEQPGVGPVTAATLLCAWSHKGRLRDHAAFAALAGTNPIPASSGATVRHRLNRGGDRNLNSALHTIAITRRRVHQATRDYATQRTTAGKTTRDINRCLRRYLARKLFRIMESTATMT